MRRGSLFLALAFVACAPPASRTTAPAPVSSAVAQPVAVAPFRGSEPPRNWQLLDPTLDGLPGVSSERAMRELLAGVKPKRTVIVAIIDGGTDTAHVDIRPNLWVNPKEIPGNGKDDDGNGHIDDVHGWNFIGGPGGKDVGPDTYELTRVATRCASSNPPYPADKCKTITDEFEKTRSEAAATLEQVRNVDSVYTQAERLLRPAVAPDSVSVARVQALQPTSTAVELARRAYLQLNMQGLTRSEIDDGIKEYESQILYGYNPSFNSRLIVGDDYANVNERQYGNADVTGPDALHGTHVAGIIGAVRDNNIGIDGIAPAVRLMIVRAVPDGDERDKDIANAIRYAAENGANVINMSFGKGYSPEKSAVDAAVQYAETKGVLMVHAAGNDGADNGSHGNFPTPVYASGGRAQGWIEVGASSWKMGDSVVASFSNYSKELVDVFAPGVDVLSTVAGGGYQRESGTSMAAPVVSGVAALLMAYFPTLTAVEVKHIILASATSHANEMVVGPGDDGKRVLFGSLSVSGGIVNAYAAVKMAQAMTAAKR